MPKGIYDRTKSKPRPRKFPYSKKELEREYLKKDKSTVDIGKETGVLATSVNKWLEKYEIPKKEKFEAAKRKRKKLADQDNFFRHPKLTEKYLRDNFVTKRKTVNQIAAEFGVSWDTVRRRTLRWELGIRNPDKRGKYKRTTTRTRTFQKKLLRHYGYKCAICGYDKFVHCCHLKRMTDTNNDDISNGIVLCPNHHHEFDYDIISVEEIKKYQKPKSIKRKSDTTGNSGKH